MKTKYKLVNIIIVTAMIIQSGCKKDQNESFVDDYNPALTEKAGTTYDGDFFPMNTGYTWDWSGQATSKGTYEGEAVNETDNVTGYMYVSQEELISLPSGSYNVFPTWETHSIRRYFEKTGSAINLRAINNLDGSEEIIEVKNPCYIRIPLVTGDKWAAQPQIDNQFLSTIDDMDISDLQIKCNFYVIGKENIIWKGQSTETVRLDERAEISGNISYEDGDKSYNMNISATIAITLNLLKNVGVVSQKEDLTISTSGDVKMTMNVKSSIALSTYYVNEIPVPLEAMQSTSGVLNLKSTNHASQKILKLINFLKRITNY